MKLPGLRYMDLRIKRPLFINSLTILSDFDMYLLVTNLFDFISLNQVIENQRDSYMIKLMPTQYKHL